MDESIRRRVEELFQRCVSLPPRERESYLAAYAGDPAVRAEVEQRLLEDATRDRTRRFDPSWATDLGEALAEVDDALEPIAAARKPPAILEPGQALGRYRIVRLLGRGGMGEVYLAEDTALERQVALKFLLPGGTDAEEQRARFLREARAASPLSHPNVCTVFEVGQIAIEADPPEGTERSLAYIAMEHVEGQGLDELIRDGTVPISRIVEIAIQVGDALEAAHSKGVIHRDIKPANIRLTKRGHVKVLDFGLAKKLVPQGDAEAGSPGDSPKTFPGTILGTPVYMSPEQALGQPVDHRSDVFSFGVALYQLITRRLPFDGSTFPEVVDRIVHARPEAIARFNYDAPAELERITCKCLEKDPEERYQSARELVIDLRKLERDQAGEGATAATRPEESTAVSTAPASPAAALPDPATVGESDIFISYAAVDDQPLSVERQGWISQLHRNLEVRVEQISGERVKIWRYPGPADSAELDAQWLASVPKAKTLVSIVSPPFVRSTGCQKQVEVFWDSAERAGNLRLESGSRVFKVVKRPVPPADVPPKLAELFASLLDYEFFEVDPETGHVREYDDAFGQTAIRRYHERVYDLAREICAVLRAVREGEEGGLPASGGATIYLATTTSDLEPRRDRVRRELLARGHSILPDRPLPLVERELKEAVEEFLERCEFAVHTIGGMYGVVPEGTDRSLLEVQNRLAAEHAARRGLRRLIWIPRGVEARDPRQVRWLEELRSDPAQHQGAEVIEDRFDSVKALLLRRLAEQAERARSPGREKPPRVYLICDRRDEQAVEEVEDFFFERGVEVSLPPFDASEAEAPEIHLENLRYCDAAVIYYGAAGRHWVESHLRELAKASGYRESGPIPVQVVYLAPPFDRRKERFKSLSVEVVRQGEQLNPRLLDSLVVRILETRTDG